MIDRKSLRERHRVDVGYLERRIAEATSNIDNNTGALVIPSALSVFVVIVVLTSSSWTGTLFWQCQPVDAHWAVRVPYEFSGPASIIFLVLALITSVAATRRVVHGFQMAQVNDSRSPPAASLSPARRDQLLEEHLEYLLELRVLVGEQRSKAYWWGHVGLMFAVLQVAFTALGLAMGTVYSGCAIQGGLFQ